jgi:hypothetical protein
LGQGQQHRLVLQARHVLVRVGVDDLQEFPGRSKKP